MTGRQQLRPGRNPRLSSFVNASLHTATVSVRVRNAGLVPPEGVSFGGSYPNPETEEADQGVLSIREQVLPTKWLPFVDTYRTFCLAPGPEAKELLLGVQQLTHLLVSPHLASRHGAGGISTGEDVS